ncbi:ABC transporter permease [Longirhabdus pacifica]|uniref:ABC transporter permease n=1 Tax=Longirhabdus pacifica TaxID=2305227 RepID=UPI0013E8D90B|nr:ABC transporter permease [Longirhabdus pacifica]
MKSFIKLFETNFKTTFREKSVIFWSILFPVILTVIFLSIFSGQNDSSSFEADIAVIHAENTVLPPLNEAINSISAFKKVESTSDLTEEEAEQWIVDQKIEAAIILPTEENSNVRIIMNLEDEDSMTAQIIYGILNQVVGEINNPTQPTDTTIEETYVSSGESDLSYTDVLITGFIALSIAQGGLFGMVSIVEMRRTGLLKRLKMTPMSLTMYSLSNLLVRFILSTIQIVLLALIGIFFYGVQFDIHLLSLIPIFIVGTVSFVAIGFLVAAITSSIDAYMGIANILSFVMMFLSGVFFSYSMMPSYLRPISDVLPLTYFVNGIRDSMLYGMGIFNADFWLNTGVLLAWMVVTFVIALKFFRWNTPENR